ncbi:19591_t:CDS:2 [Cetraspora pellucida]|uniref:19591_t:CDS:1 n=1 Tax=Cetraspora pellucida TaxID=1433469 RepID=A0A9N9CW00_9GLOM|nr:19591_t:CDS:2 [Cetraspora pellucida]
MSSNQKTYCRKETLSTSVMYNKKNINNIDLQCTGLNKVVNENIVENIIENDNLLTDHGNNYAQIALQKKPYNDNVHRSHSQQCLGLPSTRSRSSSRSSNVSNWLMNHCSATSALECGCGCCILCLASVDNMSIIESRPASTKTTPRASRRNSVTSRRNSVTSRQKCQKCLNYGIPDIPEENCSSFNKKQHQLSILKRLYRHQLEHKTDYRKSCENLELELQKFVSTALMDSSCDDFYENFEGFACHKCRNDSKKFDLIVDPPKNDGSIWRKRIWNYLKEKILTSSLISSNTSYNNNSSEDLHIDVFDDLTNNNWSNYYKYDDYSNSSSTYSNDTRNDDDSTPFPSSFAIIGVLVGVLQNGFIHSRRNGNLNFNSKRKSIGGPILDIISLALYTKKNRSVKSKRDILVMMRVIKYVTVLFVGWSVGRMGV